MRGAWIRFIKIINDRSSLRNHKRLGEVVVPEKPVSFIQLFIEWVRIHDFGQPILISILILTFPNRIPTPGNTAPIPA
jgi:hypothetical protein